MNQIIPKPESLAKLVFLVRGEKVLMDADLAGLYDVATKALNQAVKRNLDRFPADFMFQLTPEEWEGMRSQIVTSYPGNSPIKSQAVTASRRKLAAVPYAFTEQGVAMLSSVLRSQRAVEVNIAIMRTFVQLRRRRPDVLTCIAKLSKHEVFTPPELANRKPTASRAMMTSSWNAKRCAFLPPPAMMAKTAFARWRFRLRFGCFANGNVVSGRAGER